jgi:integrase
MRLTATTIRTLTLPSGVVDRTFFDDTLANFGVRVRAGGSRTFVVQYKINGKHRRMPLGSVDALSLTQARATAKDILAAVRLGRDVAGEKLEQREKQAETFGAILPRFLQRQRAKLKPRSYEETERHLLLHVKSFHKHSIESLNRRMIAVRLGELAEDNGPAAANRVRASLSAYCAWMVREGLLEANPVIGTNKAPEGGARHRVLTDDELATIWKALDDDQYGTIVKLLILTGARRDEIAGLRWSEIDLDRALIVLPAERTKNRRVFEIALAPQAVAILQAQPRRTEIDGALRDLVFGTRAGGFQDWSGSKSDLDARIKAMHGQPIADWRLHDFRRSLSTAMHERLGVLPHVVEACLGHVSGHLGGVAGIYNRSAYAEQKRIALEKWAAHVETLIGGNKKAAAVVKLPRRR